MSSSKSKTHGGTSFVFIQTLCENHCHQNFYTLSITSKTFYQELQGCHRNKFTSVTLCKLSPLNQTILKVNLYNYTYTFRLSFFEWMRMRCMFEKGKGEKLIYTAQLLPAAYLYDMNRSLYHDGLRSAILITGVQWATRRVPSIPQCSAFSCTTDMPPYDTLFQIYSYIKIFGSSITRSRI